MKAAVLARARDARAATRRGQSKNLSGVVACPGAALALAGSDTRLSAYEKAAFASGDGSGYRGQHNAWYVGRTIEEVKRRSAGVLLLLRPDRVA